MNILEKILGTIKVGDISVATTIAVTGLVIALVTSIVNGASDTIITSIASGLTGYIGGRVTK